MKDMTGQTFVHRLPVLVLDNGISQLLNVAKIPVQVVPKQMLF